MKIKEIHIGVTYPYQLAPYMYGRVEKAELLVVEEGDDPESLKKERFEKMLIEAKEAANEIVCGDAFVVETKKQTETSIAFVSLPTRRRRF